MCIKTWIYTKLFGKQVGIDEYGNKYYQTKNVARSFARKNRWVYYNGIPEASKVPATWFRWLHYQTDIVPDPKSMKSNYEWEKPSVPNLTGTQYAYFPPGHIFANNKREKATGDYQSWNPNE